jgi:hypothetical protein
MIDIDFYQHLLLATWLFLISARWLSKRYTMMIVMGTAILWEASEYFYNLDAYSNIMHWKKDTLIDLLAAIIACVFCVLTIKDRP